MAIDTNINPWAYGAVVVDQRPYMQFYQQQQAQRQAKETALDNYFKDLGKNVTPAGMRSQDVPGLTQKANEWRQFYAQNKDAITNPSKDGGKAYTEYMSRYQDQLGYINQSKNELKTDEEFNKLRLDPNRAWILDDPNIMDKYKRHTLPLNDPTRQSLNLAEFTLPPKPWGIKDQTAHSAYLTQGLTLDPKYGKAQDIGGFKTLTPITKQYSDDSLILMGDRSGARFDTDRSLQYETVKLKNQAEKDPLRYSQLNNTFKRLYGRDMSELRDFRIAHDIMNENRKSLEYKEGEDTYGRQLALESVRFGHQRQLKREDQKIANDWVVNYWDKRFSDAKSNQPVPLPGPRIPTLTYRMGYQLQPDQVMMEALKKGGVYPDDVFVTPNNKILPVFYKYKDVLDEQGRKIGTDVDIDDNGNPVVDENYTKPLELDQAYLSMGYKGQTKKDLGGTMQGVYGGTNKQQPNTKTGGDWRSRAKKVQ
jgi:DNA-binding protein Fis